MRSMVTKCAESAHELGYKYFGIQFYGECHGSKSGHLNFDQYGKGSECIQGKVQKFDWPSGESCGPGSTPSLDAGSYVNSVC